MSVWRIMESFLSRHVMAEEKMYRGETMVRMKDLRALFKKLAGDEDEPPKSSDPQVRGEPNPEGGSVSCTYSVDARVWGRWSPNPDFAKVLAGTDKQDTQHRGQPYGGTVMKKNYGGRVVYQPGPSNADKAVQAPSSMDRYDVLMVAEVRGGAIEPGQPVNWAPNQKVGMPSIVVQRIAWSPAIGTSEERQARLQALISGQKPAQLSRRPQPEKPDPPANSQQLPAQPVPRVGQNLRIPKTGSAED
jgi:hypothetical protein